jgi:hypothetical protein
LQRLNCRNSARAHSISRWARRFLISFYIPDKTDIEFVPKLQLDRAEEEIDRLRRKNQKLQDHRLPILPLSLRQLPTHEICAIFSTSAVNLGEESSTVSLAPQSDVELFPTG